MLNKSKLKRSIWNSILFSYTFNDLLIQYASSSFNIHKGVYKLNVYISIWLHSKRNIRTQFIHSYIGIHSLISAKTSISSSSNSIELYNICIKTTKTMKPPIHLIYFTSFLRSLKFVYTKVSDVFVMSSMVFFYCYVI